MKILKQTFKEADMIVMEMKYECSEKDIQLACDHFDAISIYTKYYADLTVDNKWIEIIDQEFVASPAAFELFLLMCQRYWDTLGVTDLKGCKQLFVQYLPRVVNVMDRKTCLLFAAAPDKDEYSHVYRWEPL